MMVTVKTNS